MKAENLSPDERNLLIGRLEFESKEIEDEFTILVVKTGISLEGNNVNPHHIRLMLEGFGVNTLPDEATSTAISKIHKSYTFFNYRIIKKIIDEWGDSTDKARLLSYEAKFKEYCKRRICEIPTNALTSGSEAKIMLYIKTDKNFDVPAGEIYSLAYELSKILGTTLLLCDVRDGCVEFHFDCLKPKCLLHLQEKDHTDTFKKLGITKLYTKDQVFYEQQNQEKDSDEDLKTSEFYNLAT